MKNNNSGENKTTSVLLGSSMNFILKVLLKGPKFLDTKLNKKAQLLLNNFFLSKLVNSLKFTWSALQPLKGLGAKYWQIRGYFLRFDRLLRFKMYLFKTQITKQKEHS